MSYNITSSEYVDGTGPLVISTSLLSRLEREQEDDFPECNFITEGVNKPVPGVETLCTVTRPWWYGEGSGRSKDALASVLKQTMGSAEILLVWEGGDSMSVLKVEDGKVFECKAVTRAGAVEREL